MATRRARLAPASEPNVIPFIDVLLVLLIIFMVTAPTPTVDLRVDMPGPRSFYSPPEGLLPTIVGLREEAAGLRYFVDDEPVEVSQLAARTLAHAIRNNPGIDIENMYADARIFLRADQNTAYGNVVDAMSALKGEGFAQVGIFEETAS